MAKAYEGQTFRGEGRGPQTRDGCSVELYRQLPYAGEIELIETWISGKNILELGCGVGRLTKHLLLRGYQVTAVDNSPEMLEFVPAPAIKICSDIEVLALDASFDTVILASFLVNTPSASQRSALLAACGRHLRPGGTFLFERYDPAWLASAAVGRAGQLGQVEMNIDRLQRYPDRVEISLRFRVEAEEWLQHFAAVSLDDDKLCAMLVEAHFQAPSWINRRWGRTVKNAV